MKLASILARHSRLGFWAVILFAGNQVLEGVLIALGNGSYSRLCYWDCTWYSSIVAHGYDFEPRGHDQGDAANWAFFPLLPLLAAGIHGATGLLPPTSLILSGKLCFLLSIFAFMKFTQAYGAKVPPIVAGALVAFSPYAIYGSTGYTEPLFLLLTCLSFYLWKTKRYVASGLGGAGLSGVRLVGGFFALSLLVGGFRERLWGAEAARSRFLLGLFLAPLGVALFMTYLYFWMGDALSFVHVMKAWGRIPGNPLSHLLAYLQGDGLARLWAVMVLLAFALIGRLIRDRRYELAAFSLPATLLPLSTGLVSMPRYLWWQAPLLLALAETLRETKLWPLYVPIAVLGLTWMYHAWMAGKSFVI